MTKKAAKKTTAVAKKETGAVSANMLEQFGHLGENDDIQGSDIICPKILLMQGLSKLVADEKVRAGTFVDSLTENSVIEKGESAEFIVLKSWRTWTVFQDTGKGQPAFLRSENFTTRPTREREETQDGARILNYETHNYFALLANEIGSEDGILPYTLSFRSTGLMASKTIKTLAQKQKMKGTNIPMCFNVFELSAEHRENDSGKFYVPKVKHGRMATEEELTSVKHWMDVMQNETVLAHEAEDEPAAVKEPEAIVDGEEVLDI